MLLFFEIITKPFWIFGVLLFSLVNMVCYVFSDKDLYIRKKFFQISLLVVYIFLVMASTVFCRNVNENYLFQLMPFHCIYKLIITGDYIDFREFILNIMLFIPYGFLITEIFHINKVRKVALLSFVFSLVVEVLQLVFKCGYFEIDDIIANVLSGIIGMGLWITMKNRVRVKR